jgi:hypothetical protein
VAPLHILPSEMVEVLRYHMRQAAFDKPEDYIFSRSDAHKAVVKCSA